MAFVVKDRVKETTTTTGTGTVTLAGAASGFQAFSAIGDGNTTHYAIVSGTNWEVGLGTYTSSGTTLSRDTVLESSNSGSKITLAGTSDVFCTYPAEKSVNTNDIGTAAALDTGISNTNVPKFTSGVADDDFLRVAGTEIEGRSASEVLSDIGGQASLTFGISNTNAVKIDSTSVADDEYARFTASGLESRSTSEVLSDIGAASSGTGTVLQVVSVQPDTGLVSFTSTSYAEVDTDLRVSITPKASDSTLIVSCNFLFGGNNESQMCQMKLYDITNTSNVNTSAAGSRTEANASVRFREHDANDGAMINLQAQTSSGSTSARTYGMYARLESAATRYFFSNTSNTAALGYAKPSITVIEVSA